MTIALIVIAAIGVLIFMLMLSERELGKIKERNRLSEEQQKAMDRAIEVMSRPTAGTPDELVDAFRRLRGQGDGSPPEMPDSN